MVNKKEGSPAQRRLRSGSISAATPRTLSPSPSAILGPEGAQKAAKVAAVQPNNKSPLTSGESVTPASSTLMTDHRLPKGFVAYNEAQPMDKSEQRTKVKAQLAQQGFIPENLVENEVSYFYDSLGIHDTYFCSEPVETIVDHILSLYGAKVAAFSRHTENPEIKLDRESRDHAVYIAIDPMSTDAVSTPAYEYRLDENYLNVSNPAHAYRVECFRSQFTTASGIQQTLRSYFVNRCKFVKESPAEDEEGDLDVVSDKAFLEKATQNTKDIYLRIISDVLTRAGPVIEIFEVEGSREHRLIVGFKQGSAFNFFSSMSDLFSHYGLGSTRKYVEQFSNGVTVVSVYLLPLPDTENKFPPIEHSIHQILKDASLLYCIPRSMFHSLFTSMTLSLQESTYAHCVYHFVGHFLNRLGPEYILLSSILDASDPKQSDVLGRIKRRLRQETFTETYIYDIVKSYPELVHELYLQFASKHYISTSHLGSDGSAPTLSYQYLMRDPVKSEDELRSLIEQRTANDHEYMVMASFLTFNQHVLKTNFYQPTKVAISFRFNPSFLPEIEYPQKLFGMFLMVGSEFRGFHLRFMNVARGGIRIVRSRNKDQYALNARSLFDENYNLAATQQRKNKDIPEGGAKGVILLDADQQDKATLAFQKYVDSLIDLLLEGTSPGIKEKIVDLHGQQEIIFCGPDEGTAGLVDWATGHARERGAPWWKAFFTGKSPSLGGIPHDVYGMTSQSVRRFVEGIYRKLDLKESEQTKLQTGGPDGDLGSNEILLGRERYVAIIDGSGVLHDPAGLNREELLRLAHGRKMIAEYDVKLLSPEGYRVLVDEQNITLPNGEYVPNGTTYRNTAHLRLQANVMVPCGGRPDSIDSSTVSQLIDPADGHVRIPYIVEGANLFISQDAKLRLEEAGCVLFKDASANKGGVTSSSLEVLASLSFDNEGFQKHMCVAADGSKPQFYEKYVREVQEIIRNNADLEFEAIWREHEASGRPRCVLSDELSLAIVGLRAQLQESTLWNNRPLFRLVLGEALPRTLVETLGLDTVLERIPDDYLVAVFASYLASRFVYKYGIAPGQFAFFEYMSAYLQRLPG